MLDCAIYEITNQFRNKIMMIIILSTATTILIIIMMMMMMILIIIVIIILIIIIIIILTEDPRSKPKIRLLYSKESSQKNTQQMFTLVRSEFLTQSVYHAMHNTVNIMINMKVSSFLKPHKLQSFSKK